jgi:broad specificity phosphatase PhoE
MKFYIFRHAETFPSKNTGGIYDENNFATPVLSSGKDITIKLAQYLKDIPSDLNVSSPFERCKETVEIITQVTGKKFIFDERVGEYFQISYPDFRARIEDFLKEIEGRDYQNIIICTHGAVMSQIVHLLCDDKPEEDIPISEGKNTGILVMVEDRSIKEINFNAN